MVVESIHASAGRGQSRPSAIRRLAVMAHEAFTAEETDGAAITGRYVRLPQWAATALVGAIVATIWWAATMSAKVDTITARIADERGQNALAISQEHNLTETYRLEVQALRKDVAYLTGLTTGKNQNRGD